MIEQYFSNTNESATVAKGKNFRKLNKAFAPPPTPHPFITHSSFSKDNYVTTLVNVKNYYNVTSGVGHMSPHHQQENFPSSLVL